MDYEKKYNEALERAKEQIEACGDNEGRKRMIYAIFPELVDNKDERIREWLVYYFKAIGKSWLHHRDISIEQILAYLEKQKEQKPAEWNANDKAFIKDCARILDENGYTASAKRLLSMFEQKPVEWSEEDEAIVGCIAVCLDGQFVSEAARKQCLEWFNKHRRDFLNRPSWKPSEEQMNKLKEVIYGLCTCGNGPVLKSLYEDLKKLI